MKKRKKFAAKQAVGYIAVAALLGSNIPAITSQAGVNDPWTTSIYVSDINVNQYNYTDVLGKLDGDKKTISYDKDTSTLKLDGVNLNCEGSSPAIMANENLVIETVSDSTIQTSSSSYAIACGPANELTLTLKGSGKLNLNNSGAALYSPNIINQGNINYTAPLSESALYASNIINQGSINIDVEESGYIIYSEQFENQGSIKINANKAEGGIYTEGTVKQASGALDISGDNSFAIYCSRYEQAGGKVSINDIVSEAVTGDLKNYSGIITQEITTPVDDLGFYCSGGELDITVKDTNKDSNTITIGVYCKDTPCDISGGKISVNSSCQQAANGICVEKESEASTFSITGGDVTCVVDSTFDVSEAPEYPILMPMSVGSSSGMSAPTIDDDLLVDVSKNVDGKDATPYKGEAITNVYRYMHVYERPIITVTGKKATCTEAGVKDYYMYDDALGKAYFSDKDAKNAIEDIDKWLASDGVIKATGHSYKNGACEYCNEKDPSFKPDPEKPDPDKKAAKVGDKFKDKAKSTYVVTNVKKKEVAFSKPANTKAKNISVPATIKVNGVSYKVVKVADKAFAGCKKLTKATIGKNVTAIGTNSFKNCAALTKLTIPAKVTKIGANAFAGCKKLKTLTIKNTKLKAKNLNKKAFSGLTKKTTIKVAKAKVKAYKKMFKEKGLSTKVAVKAY